MSGTMVNTLLTTRGATVRARGKILIGPVDLTLSPQGVSIIIGPNGAGKTTLLKMLYGIARLADGAITWHSANDHLPQAFVFQSPVMLRRTVRDNIAYPLQLAGIGKRSAHERAEDWAARIGLQAVVNAPARQLSGGERQKLAVARALITDPKVLFLDEPCAFLDGRATREVEAILQAAAQAGTRLIMSTHDLGQARRLATDIIFVQGGRVRETGPAVAFFAAPETDTAQAFLRGDIVE